MEYDLNVFSSTTSVLILVSAVLFITGGIFYLWRRLKLKGDMGKTAFSACNCFGVAKPTAFQYDQTVSVPLYVMTPTLTPSGKSIVIVQDAVMETGDARVVQAEDILDVIKNDQVKHDTSSKLCLFESFPVENDTWIDQPTSHIYSMRNSVNCNNSNPSM